MIRRLIALLCVTVVTAAADDIYPAGVWSNVPDISDRQFWEARKDAPGMQEKIRRAEQEITEDVVSPLPDYLEFSKNGNRSRYEDKYFRLHRMGALVMAACVTNDRRFVNYIERRIKEICALPTWVLPAHDAALDNYHGKTVDIDLGVATLGAELACLLRLLTPVLTPETRILLEQELERRILTPLDDMMHGKRKENMWLTIRNNWNSVCLAGMTAVVLRQPMNANKRAALLNYIRERSVNFLLGFSKDGYCGEGISYWSYGFGYYMRMAADFRQATNGRVELLNRPDAMSPARFAENIQLAPGVFPAFADADINFQMPLFVACLQNWLEHKAPGFPEDFRLPDPLQDICLVLSLPGKQGNMERTSLPDVTIFENANVYLARPGNSDSRLAVGFKGGNNAEQHNHNDVGSYIVAVDDVPIVIDPGREIYTKRTFSKQRYESKLLNSYGHSIPKIAGQLQAAGRGTDAVRKHLHQDDDTLAVSLEISAPYRHIGKVSGLERLFTYSRENSGRFTVEDTATFTVPVEYENAVITLGRIDQLNEHTFRITEKGKKLLLTIDCGDVRFTTFTDTIRENTRHKRDVIRLGIRATEPVKSITMLLTFTPEAEIR